MARILIIDDEEIVRFSLREMLEMEGHQVDEAANGFSGIARLRDTEYDLVLSDMIMPEKAGPQTIQEIRDIRPGIKIIAMSGGDRLGGQDLLKQSRKLGADDVLPKPFSQNALLNMIDRLLGRH